MNTKKVAVAFGTCALGFYAARVGRNLAASHEGTIVGDLIQIAALTAGVYILAPKAMKLIGA
jgi:hypothetical protein